MKYSAIKLVLNQRNPIHFKDRELGQSKMNIGILESFSRVLKLRSKKFENKSIIRNAEIINENQKFIGDLAIEDSFISEIKMSLFLEHLI